MKRIIRPVLLLSLLFLATGCSTYSLQELKTATPKGTPFQAQLAVRYMHFSEEKAEKYNWIDSGYFADKGLRAAYGHDVPPEDVNTWDLPGDKVKGLEAAHAELMKALPSGIEQQPREAADAQAFFDCWVENQSNDWQADEIAYCRDNFAQALRKLKPAPAESAATQKNPKPPAAPLKQAYIVFFGLNQDSLDDKSSRIVDGVAEDLKKQEGAYSIVLNGHADTVGNKRYNFDLSRKRAQSVKEALTERGIPKKLIRTFGFGDTDPKVPTGPGVPERKNRRVEIYIGD